MVGSDGSKLYFGEVSSHQLNKPDKASPLYGKSVVIIR